MKKKAVYVSLSAAFLWIATMTNAHALPSEIPHETRAYALQSGVHPNLLKTGQYQQVFEKEIRVPGVPWIQLHFGKTLLPGKSYLVVTSLQDGDSQRLDRKSLEEWGHATAYFNGDAVVVRLFAGPEQTDVSLSIDTVTVGKKTGVTRDDKGGARVGVIFGADDRVPSLDPRVARIVPTGCTGWLVSNGAFLTAGHCNDGTMANVQFNVPLSQNDGTIVNPPARDQYPINAASIQSQLDDDPTPGSHFTKDWAVFAVNKNASGESPIQNQQGFYRMTTADFTANTTNARVTGFGVDGPPPDYGKTGPRNKYSQTNQTATGQYLGVFSSGTYVNNRYKVNTLGGNSGSPVMVNGATLTVGIHDGGVTGSFNHATSFQLAELKSALQGFSGTQVNPAVPAANTFYVDNGAAFYVAARDGQVMTPYDNVTAAMTRACTFNTPTVVSIVAGNYPEIIDQTTSVTNDIIIPMLSDITVMMPVGDVAVWAPANAPN